MRYRLWIMLVCVLMTGTFSQGWAYTYKSHENISEDAFLFMESHGSNQMRWAADYMKAKAGGRYTGVCLNKTNKPDDIAEGTALTECGAIGIARVGGINPDYFTDAFWDDLTAFNWNYPNPFLKNNFTSWFHFINLIPGKADAGHPIKNNVYNEYDGYSYQATYGFPDTGIDYAVAAMMNNAQMSIDLPNCTHHICSEKYSIVPNGNPATDYKQNGSTTPLGAPSNNEMKTGTAKRTNYNCFSDMAFHNCPDNGAKLNNKDDYYQIPNTDSDPWLAYGYEDWVIYEPADNASTFYYNEFFLEGGASRNSSLQTPAIANRYYTLTGPELLYLAVTSHWAGDVTHPAHIWSTIGYNHGEYEEWSDEHYGTRVAGGNNSNNFENYEEAVAFMEQRQNRDEATIEQIFMEQAFFTYHIRMRSGYDVMTSTNDATRTRLGKWSINNAIAMVSVIFEKGVLDLRKYK
ncbi:MAG: hypothetical protein HQM12_01925 [SAR324 cluster bacterium]|nr:hypothetical protein [SAR324 cluster bacterium]